MIYIFYKMLMFKMLNINAYIFWCVCVCVCLGGGGGGGGGIAFINYVSAVVN